VRSLPNVSTRLICIVSAASGDCAMSAAWRARGAAAAVLRATATSGPATRLFAADGSSAVATAAAASATPALDKFRERLSTGPDFAAFVASPPGTSKDGYSLPAPPLKVRQRTPTCAALPWRASQRACTRWVVRLLSGGTTALAL